ncbi:MAG: response regulator [Saprospiraceae bacterium]
MKNSTVLVIEDQLEVRENLMETLELADYQVLGAPDGHEGVKLVREHKPDLILCDVMMPKLDGFGVLELLQKDPSTASIPFIFLTARAEREDLRRGMNLGAADYITKPFFQDELLRVVAMRLEKQEGSTKTLQSKTVGSSQAEKENALSLLDQLSDKGRSRSYNERATVYFKGDQVHNVYKVISGRVRFFMETDFGKTLTIDSQGSGSWFGMEDLYAEGVRSVSAGAYPDAEILLVDKTDFLDLINRHPSLVRIHMRQFSQDLALRAEQLLQVAYYSVRKRVAEFLLRSVDRNPNPQFAVDLRREDIAEAVGTTPESVTRVLTEFRKEGFVNLPSQGGIEVVDKQALQEVPA